MNALEEYKLKYGTIVGFPGATPYDAKKNGPLIEQPCDILGACAKEKVYLFHSNIIDIFFTSNF